MKKNQVSPKLIRWVPGDLYGVIFHFLLCVTLLGVFKYNPYYVVTETFLMFIHGMLFATVGVVRSMNDNVKVFHALQKEVSKNVDNQQGD